MALGKEVRRRREALGWTQGKLSEESGVEVGTISALETRDSKTSRFTLQLASALGVQVGVLLGGKAVQTATLEVREQSPAKLSTGASIREALGILGLYIRTADPGARKAAGMLLASWAEDPAVNRGTADTLERMLQPHVADSRVDETYNSPAPKRGRK